jgi:hypothetical protein
MVSYREGAVLIILLFVMVAGVGDGKAARGAPLPRHARCPFTLAPTTALLPLRLRHVPYAVLWIRMIRDIPPSGSFDWACGAARLRTSMTRRRMFVDGCVRLLFCCNL